MTRPDHTADSSRVLRSIEPTIAVLSLLFALTASCAGPPTPSAISGEPVCADFDVGASKTRMRGGLRLPVSLTILDGDKPIFRTTILGLRTDKDAPTRILLRDDDAEYKVEWAQCENERAPRAAAEAPAPKSKSQAPTKEPPAEYECGKGVAYKTEKLVTKKGDIGTHALTFPPPPKTECWASEAPAAASAAADAGAPPAVSAEPSTTSSAVAAPSGTPSAVSPASAAPSAPKGAPAAGSAKP